MEITDIDRDKKNKERLSVYVDGKYCFSIQEEDFLRLGMYEKKEISQEEIDYIKSDLNFRQAKNTAIKYMSIRYRSEKEVYKKLKDIGFDDSEACQAIDELKSIGYINDMIYAQKYVHDRCMLKPKSKKMLKFELVNKGIADRVADEVLESWDVDESSVAEGLVRKKFGKYDIRDADVVKKVYSFLRHRGYSFEIIEGVIKNVSQKL